MKTTKKLIGLLVLTVAMIGLSATAETKVDYTYSEMGRYWLKKAANNMLVNNQELETYVIHYDNYAKPVYVGILEAENCKSYVVRSDNFEVLYTCKDGQFGINYMPDYLATLPAETSRANINRVHYLKQRVISNQTASEKTQLSLIASYLPDVIM